MTETEFARLESLIKSADQKSQNWNTLQVFTQPSITLGVFLLALGLPMLAAAATELDIVVIITQVLAGGLFIVWGVLAIIAPWQIQLYFVQRTEKLSEFFAAFRGADYRTFARHLGDWAKKEGKEALSLRQAARAIQFGITIGVWAMTVVGTLYIIFYIVMVMFVNQLSTGFAIILAMGPILIVGISLLILKLKRRPKSKGPHSPGGVTD